MTSRLPSPDTLGLSRKVLRTLIKLNILMGIFIVGMLVASLVAPGYLMQALGVDPVATRDAQFRLSMRLIMLLGIVAVPITHTVLARLLAIVDTVRDGDPFISGNAHRLQQIAWSVLTLELMHLVIVAIAANASTPATPLNMGSTLSITRWLAVLFLFVLARVFEHGSRMREDLEGTV